MNGRRAARVWVAVALLLAPLLQAAADGGPRRPATAPYEAPAFATPASPIDDAIFARLRREGVAPAPPCSDAVFVRRVYLDVTGTLPTARAAREFLADARPDKRSRLIDQLLARDEFADYWAMKWCDALRVKSEFPINLWPNAVQAYHRWVRASLAEDKPYDRFARELLTASGSNFRQPPVNFWRATQGRDPEALAQAVALTFMGSRTDRWPAEQRAGMAAFFASVRYKATGEWKEEIVYFDPLADSTTRPTTQVLPIFPDGTVAEIPPDRDPREAFADWLVTPQNPWFTRAVVNRVWFWLMGRGLVHEPDDIRPDNPASHPEVLAALERTLIANRYDLKAVYRQILNSRAYQLSSIPADCGESPPPELFSSYALRRLEAEVLIDAICQVTGTTERYSSAIPEPFTFIPEEQRSIALADGSITSSFLELFGRPSRDSGMLAERNNGVTANQRLHLLNSSHVRRKIEQGPGLRPLIQSKRPARQVAEDLYLTILSRPPTQAEVSVITRYARSGAATGREVWVDVAWALMNGSEFLYRH